MGRKRIFYIPYRCLGLRIGYWMRFTRRPLGRFISLPLIQNHPGYLQSVGLLQICKTCNIWTDNLLYRVCLVCPDFSLPYWMPLAVIHFRTILMAAFSSACMVLPQSANTHWYILYSKILFDLLKRLALSSSAHKDKNKTAFESCFLCWSPSWYWVNRNISLSVGW